ncbi:DUF1996 domain-containing protein [Candidatus Bathyarchaeota archaeon]|nr:DUF1996 domain-containing protein [Candidatus Bathyarchaeota archaeon]
MVVKNDDGSRTPVPYSRFSAYYVGIESAEIAIPQDYSSVAGNAKATSQDDVPELAGHSWFCEGGPEEDDKDPAAWPRKTCSTHLQTLLLFHDCVNPDTLESDYSGTQHWTNTDKPENRCPAGMSRMPQLRLSIRYDLRKALPDGWDGPPPFELACGDSYCFHGDFINGWIPEAAENMLLANSKRDFAGVDGPLGKYKDGSTCKRDAVDADPENGTSDYLESMEILEKVAGTVSEKDESESRA